MNLSHPVVKVLGMGIVGIILAVATYYYFNPLVPKIRIANTTFTYDIAITPEQITRGLSGRDELADKHGMLFVFDHEEQFRFWMKEMKFPIDIIWIKEDKVIDVSKNVPAPQSPTDELPTYTPKQSVNRVLELKAGSADTYGIVEGSKVEYLKK